MAVKTVSYCLMCSVVALLLLDKISRAKSQMSQRSIKKKMAAMTLSVFFGVLLQPHSFWDFIFEYTNHLQSYNKACPR